MTNTETFATAAAKIVTRIGALASEGVNTLDALQIAAQETLDSMILNGAPATAVTADKALNFTVIAYRAASELAAA